ncbi:hypothetical protein FRACYDRAFT_244129 [Fragilariopsis cylindrus CCMP1102]|uniref:Uncharacterized protein n=1 Tax=Fragilariopsis cylindrus CCMP1102 TaxID=635003 RepID=A0A1E7F3Y3_9STRA|nr:hypothetical protein FRACYDRAFT_244129 [Fragilariopsis cylindrus CCMP1102]|eukprot:OEU12857.1 hypothetical protein FRACYDRAFT_244129 [Fragilariopsis cylindrus CCMP1102]
MKESQSESLISESDSDDYHDSISSYQDIEGGGGDDNNIEPIPNLDIYDGDDDDNDEEEEEDSSTIWSTMTYFSSSSTARRQRRARAVARARKNNNNDTTRVALLKLMYRQYVASQQTQNSNNPQASLWFLGKLFIVAVYFISLIEEPLDYIMGTTASSSTANSKRNSRDQNNNDDNDSITKGYIKTDLGVIHYMISKPMKPKPTPMKKQQQIPPSSSSSTTTPTTTPIVCFHSSNRSSDEFYNVLPLFAARHKRQQQGQQGDEGRIVIAIDIVGFGNSSNPYNAYASIDDIATSCLLEVCDKLLLPLLPLSTTKDSNSNSSNSKSKQLSNKYIVIGSKDVGCYIATSLVCRFPQRIQSCILVNLCHPKELKILGSLLSLSLSTSTSTGGGENNNNNNNNNNNISYFDLNQSSLSLNKLCVLQNKITNAILLKQRKQQGIKIQNLITYDLGRDSRRMQSCPILMIQIIRKHKRHNNRKRTENPASAAASGGGGGNVKIRNLFVDTDNDTDNDDDLINENAKEFVSICDEFILTSTRASASADNNDVKRV